MSQTSYSINPAVAKEGMLADSRNLKHIQTGLAEGPIKAGLACFRAPGVGAPYDGMGKEPVSVWQTPSPVQAADVDAIIATIASSASIQTLSGTDLDGVVADAYMYPPRLATLTLSTSTDWDATNATVTGELDGVVVTDTLAIPDGGNATVTGTQYFDRITSLSIPAQTGTGGTADLGVAVLDSSVTLADFEGFAFYDNSLIPDTVPSQDQTAEYHDKDAVSLLVVGAIWVVSEDAVAASDRGAAPFARITSGSGGSTIGSVRTDADTSTAIALTGWRFATTASAGGLVKIERY